MDDRTLSRRLDTKLSVAQLNVLKSQMGILASELRLVADTTQDFYIDSEFDEGDSKAVNESKRMNEKANRAATALLEIYDKLGYLGLATTICTIRNRINGRENHYAFEGDGAKILSQHYPADKKAFYHNISKPVTPKEKRQHFWTKRGWNLTLAASLAAGYGSNEMFKQQAETVTQLEPQIVEKRQEIAKADPQASIYNPYPYYYGREPKVQKLYKELGELSDQLKAANDTSLPSEITGLAILTGLIGGYMSLPRFNKRNPGATETLEFIDEMVSDIFASQFPPITSMQDPRRGR